ncbi:hypothetical protein MUK42_09955 [Musa troglodytarum]|uniref:Uncharacterized protein n=1 Tax=Musa troglodytarum TaxID=320322 RepID=A0A9E7GM76_9LILI|nr:hypothetical protein MUK42_09955 [Musa troglodytarum]
MDFGIYSCGRQRGVTESWQQSELRGASSLPSTEGLGLLLYATQVSAALVCLLRDGGEDRANYQRVVVRISTKWRSISKFVSAGKNE